MQTRKARGGVGRVGSSSSAAAPAICRHRYVSGPPSWAKLSRPSSTNGSERSKSTWTVAGVPFGWATATGSDSPGGDGGGVQAPGIAAPATVSNNPIAQRIEIMASLQLKLSSGAPARCVQPRKESFKRSTPVGARGGVPTFRPCPMLAGVEDHFQRHPRVRESPAAVTITRVPPGSSAVSIHKCNDANNASGRVPCPSPAQPSAGMFSLAMAALRLAMAPEKQNASEH